MLERILRGLHKQGDALIQKLQKEGLAGGARLARRLLGEPPPHDGDWTPAEYRTLDAVLARMCNYEGRDLPRPADTFALEAVLDFVDSFPAGRKTQLRDLLALFEAGSLILGPKGEFDRFSKLSAQAADAYLNGWDQANLPPRRAAFRALKSICMMGYWSQSGTWQAIGYSLEENPGLSTDPPLDVDLN